MKKFMDKDFLLKSETAKKLYHEYSENLPIVDYHCHINPKEIYEDIKYDNITQVWLYGDHYKWRAMRSAGIDEKYITGDATDYEKFCKFAETLESAIGNPLYHWSHMELKKYFGYEGVLNSKTAPEVWALTKNILSEGLSAGKIIEMSNVEVVCTTDDPVDDLIWHEKIKAQNLEYKVLPAWRPDKLVNIDKPDFAEYMARLQEVSGVKIKDKESLKEAVCNRLDYFEERGCSISDHGLDHVPYNRCTDAEFDSILERGLRGEVISPTEAESYKTEVLLMMSAEYSKRNWVMQLHYGCHRNNNSDMFDKLGPDTGFDSISNYTPSEKLSRFMDAANTGIRLPKTIIYSLNPTDNAVIGAMIGCFQDGSAASKIQHGSAWWFNDNKVGMEQQMISLANLGVLGKFIGMLTDSRSFLSYTRHEYFRRIMCNLLGEWVENGEYPEDYDTLEKIVKGISYENAIKYFGF